MSEAIDYDPFVGAALIATVASTEAQREIWTSAQLGEDASCAFNESITLRIDGPLDAHCFEDAVAAVAHRHDALRCTFSPDGSLLCVAAASRPGFRIEDRQGLDDAAQALVLQQAAREEVTTPFDLEHGPLWRVRILRFGDNKAAILITAHHIICDGWSLSILVRDLATCYSADVRGKTVELPEAGSFEAYSQRMNAFAQSEEGRAEESYWLSVFAEPVPPLELPTDRSRPPVKTFSAARVDHPLDSDLVRQLRQVGAKGNASFFVTLLTAFGAFLHRITGQDELVIGVPAAGQSALGMENLIGHCVNLLPIRSRLGGDPSMMELLKEVRSTALDAFDHQRYTFGTLVRKLKIQRDPSRIPLVSVLFNLDQPTADDQLGFEGLTAHYASNPRAYENFEIFINASETKAGVTLECQFNTDLFDHESIENYLESFEAFLRGFVHNPMEPVRRLPLLSHRQQQQVLVDWNATVQEYDSTQSVIDLFDAQVRAKPERIAVQCDDRSLTYQELHARARQLATHLVSAGIGRGDLVGLCVERSENMVVGLLGILKAGAAYVPLDPGYPAERLRFMIEDAGLAHMVTETSLMDDLPVLSAPMICLDAVLAEPLPDRGAPNVAIEPNDLAYVIYTSGSTGKPKGVQVPHGAAVNFLRSMSDRPGIEADDILVAVTTLCFDIAVLELLLPLVNGAKVVIASRDVASDGLELLELLRSSQATFLQATPSTWRLLLEAGWAGEPHLKALCGGEAMPADLVPRLLETTSSLWNMYGPTETTVWSTCAHITRADAPVTIGKPIANTQVYILDANGEPVPPGVPGELYIGGAGVTLGYRHRTELTQERFVANPYHDPFASYVSSALYRTGDIVRFRPGGTLEYLRRNDFQIKLRGYRIELGEIETVLARQAGIGQSVVAVWQSDAADARLVAYYVPAAGKALTATELRRGLRAALPDYMVPQHFVELDSLPRTNNNKIDRKALPAPIGAGKESIREVTGPRTEREQLLASIWQRLLGVSSVSIHDNFFQLGGHSLTAMQAIVEIQQMTGTRLSPRLLLLSTLEQVAAQLPQETLVKPAAGDSAAVKRPGRFRRLLGA